MPAMDTTRRPAPSPQPGVDDPTRVADLFERHVAAVVRHCHRRTGDWGVAQDLTSAVFFEVVRRPGRVRVYQGSALPWLLATANNLDRNRSRALRRWARTLRRAGATSVDGEQFEDDANARIDRQREFAAARALLDRLTERERDVFLLCEWADLTYEQAAAALGIPIGTVRSRLARARRRLRQAVRQQTSGKERP